MTNRRLTLLRALAGLSFIGALLVFLTSLWCGDSSSRYRYCYIIDGVIYRSEGPSPNQHGVVINDAPRQIILGGINLVVSRHTFSVNGVGYVRPGSEDRVEISQSGRVLINGSEPRRLSPDEY